MNCNTTHYRANSSSVPGDPTDLGTLGGDESEALFISENGEVVVGLAQNENGDWRLSRWTAVDGMENLGSLGGDSLIIKDVSDDASVIVGTAVNNLGASVPFIWQLGDRIRRVPNVGDVVGSIEFVSDDGSTIYGQAAIGSPILKAFQADVETFTVVRLGSLVDTRAAFVSSASMDGSVIGGQSFNSDGELEAFLRVESTTPVDKLVSLTETLKEVFGEPRVQNLFFVDVPCISHDGQTLIVEAVRNDKTVFVYVEVDEYPSVDDGGSFFETRPYYVEIQQYVDLSYETAASLSESYPDVAAAYYVYLYAYYASEYQKLAASLEGEATDELVGLYASYRYNALLLTYYAYVYHYYYVYLPSGGEAEGSVELLTYLYYSYYYQALDVDEFYDE